MNTPAPPPRNYWSSEKGKQAIKVLFSAAEVFKTDRGKPNWQLIANLIGVYVPGFSVSARSCREKHIKITERHDDTKATPEERRQVLKMIRDTGSHRFALVRDMWNAKTGQLRTNDWVRNILTAEKNKERRRGNKRI